MAFFPVVNGKKLPEIYHFGFNGTHFQVFLPFAYWSQFVDLAGKGAYYTSNQSQAYIPPVISGEAFGEHGCANASRALDGSACIEIRAFSEKTDDELNELFCRELCAGTLLRGKNNPHIVNVLEVLNGYEPGVIFEYVAIDICA